MASVDVKGIDQIEMMFGTMRASTRGIAKASLYEGAKVIADELRSETKRLKQNEPGRPKEDNAKKIYRSVTDLEKNDLLKSIGIMTFATDLDGCYTLIGFAGYGSRKTKTYPQGLPNPLLARSVSKPSAMRKGRRFTKIAAKAGGYRALEAMHSKANKMLDAIARQ